MSADDYGEPCTTQRLRAMVADLRPDILAHSTTAWAADEIEHLRAELAALKARRCDGCAWWDHPTRECTADDVHLSEYAVYTAPDHACNAWEPKP